MSNASRADREIFEEFYSNQEELAFESEKVSDQFKNTIIEQKYQRALPEQQYMVGDELASYVKTKVNRYLFRGMELSNYNSFCVITGISIKPLLIASHIKPWSEGKKQRLNPANDICLSALYDKAFDKGLITFVIDY